MLEQGASFVAVATYVVTQADIDNGSITNLVKVAGYFEDEDIWAEDEITVYAEQTPAMIVNKTANKESFSQVGETIEYSFKITNVGNVVIRGPFTVLDDKIAVLVGPSGDENNNGHLDVGETWTYTGTYIVTPADVRSGKIVNTVSVTTSQIDTITDFLIIRFDDSDSWLDPWLPAD